MAAPPDNDDFGSATNIASLPFSQTIDTTGASSADTDPFDCFSTAQSVWYTFTPTAPVRLRLDTTGSSYQAALGVYMMENDSLIRIACNSTNIFNTPDVTPAQLVLDLPADQTLFIMATDGRFEGGGSLTLNAAVAPAGPANDDFDTPTPLALGGAAETDVTNASVARDDEPSGCGFPSVNQTVWYSFTPERDMHVEVRAEEGSDYSPMLAAFTGARGALAELGCAFPGGALRFPVVAQQTYYLLAGTFASQHGTLNRITVAEFFPLAVEIAVDPTATVDQRTGEVTVTGTILTNKLAGANWGGNLTQNQGRAIVSGGTFGFVENIDGSTAWSTTFRSNNLLIFGGGRADLTLDFGVFGADEFISEQVQTQVRVVGKRTR